jgi:hypothetical protein
MLRVWRMTDVKLQARLGELEKVIEDGLVTFVEVGRALTQIRDERLYKPKYSRFEDYCRERWNWSRVQAHRTIDAAEVVGSLLPMGNKLPASERQARPLAVLAKTERQRAWGDAVGMAEREGKPVSVRHVEAAVNGLSGNPGGFKRSPRRTLDFKMDRAMQQLEAVTEFLEDCLKDAVPAEHPNFGDWLDHIRDARSRLSKVINRFRGIV